jgi:hypothetical protein
MIPRRPQESKGSPLHGAEALHGVGPAAHEPLAQCKRQYHESSKLSVKGEVENKADNLAPDVFAKWVIPATCDGQQAVQSAVRDEAEGKPPRARMQASETQALDLNTFNMTTWLPGQAPMRHDGFPKSPRLRICAHGPRRYGSSPWIFSACLAQQHSGFHSARILQAQIRTSDKNGESQRLCSFMGRIATNNGCGTADLIPQTLEPTSTARNQ